jgi:hypothetical protein
MPFSWAFAELTDRPQQRETKGALREVNPVADLPQKPASSRRIAGV